MNRAERVAKLERNLAELRSRALRVWAESDLLVRDVRLVEAELTALLREPVAATPGGVP